MKSLKKFVPFFVIFFVLISLLIYVNVKEKYNNLKIIDVLYSRFKNNFTFVPGNGNLAGVDMVYAITMPERKDYITSQMNKLGIRFTCFNAITPSDLTPDDYNNLSYTNKSGSRIYKKYTRLAVFLSFILCFIHSLKHGYSTIVLFEDDISILAPLDVLNESLLEFKNSNMDAFYMGYCFLNCKQNVNKYKNFVELSDPNLICGHSFAIKTRILQDLIDYCFPMTTASDEMFRNYYQSRKTKVVVPHSVYFTQNRESLGSLNESTPDPNLFKTCKF